MHFDEIIRHFDKPKPNGANSYMVRCPIHDDSTQSLCITEKDGKILMNCFAGCRTQDILWAVGLQESDLFNTSSTSDRPPSVEYLYTPDLKKVRFYVLNNGEWKKTFCWKHRNANSSWEKGTGGLPIPLYRQNQLEFTPIIIDEPMSWDAVINEPDAPETTKLPPVYIVEGEKDADTMNEKLGLTAVSSPHGGTSGKLDSKWRDEWNSLFADRDVVLLPDNDEVGVAFADMVARKLVTYAKSVRIVHLAQEWDTLPKKGDITDVLAIQQPYNGKSVTDCVRDKLEALAICTPVFDPNVIPREQSDRGNPLPLETGSNDKGIATAPVEPRNDSNDPEWDTPVPFDNYNPPEFPIEALPPTIRAYAVSAAESIQVPVDMCASACLAVLALCMQGKYSIMGKADWFEPLNLYVLCIAMPSERKSTILSKVAGPINSYEADYNRRHALDIENSRNEYAIMEKTRERLITMIADKKAGKSGASEKLKKVEEEMGNSEERVAKLTEEILNFKFKQSMKLYCEDITSEKLASVLEENDGSIGILSSEGGIFEIMNGAYSSNNAPKIDVFLQAWSGDSIRVDRVNRPSNNIEHPALTMLLMVQPHVISGLVNNKTFSGRGLTARFLYCMPKSAVGHRRFDTVPIPETVNENYHDLMTNLLDDEKKEKPKLIRLSDEAREYLKAFYEQLEPNIPAEYAELAGWMGKLVGTILRIAGIFTRAMVADRIARASFDEIQDMDTDTDNLVVSGETMKGAIAVGEYYFEHARAAFSLMGADEVSEMAAFALEVIGRKGLNGFKTSDLMRACKKFKTADYANEILRRLTEMGYLREEKPESKKSGRPPAPKYHVNPIYLESLKDSA